MIQTVSFRNLLQQLRKRHHLSRSLWVEKPISYFDTFVKEWYDQGGEEITEQIRKTNLSK